MKTEILTENNLEPFSKLILDTYLDKVYKNLEQTHPCEQSITQIAISHVEYLYDIEQIELEECDKFYQMAKIVI